MTRKCSICGGSGPFGPSKSSRDGLKSRCRECCADKQREYASKNRHVWKNWSAKNSDYLKSRDSARYAANPEGEKSRVRAYQRENPGKTRGWALKSLYGITLEEKQELFVKQGGVCPICKVSLIKGRGSTGMQVDHDHITGKVRGLLCHLCNVALGSFLEDHVRLGAACDYLQRGLVEIPMTSRPPGIRKSGSRVRNLWYNYKLTEETLHILWCDQGRECVICRKSLTRKEIHIDHDHKIGVRAVRGLLCRTCNQGLGQARDNIEILRQAVEYLANQGP